MPNFNIVRHLGSSFEKIIFWVTWPEWRKWQGKRKTTAYFCMGLIEISLVFWRNLLLWIIVMESVHENQVDEVFPYQYEPEVGEKAASRSAWPTKAIRSQTLSDSASSDDGQIDDEFETANAWRLQTVSWCECGHFTLSTRRLLRR